MNYNRLFPQAGRAGIAFGAAILVTALSGCSPSNDTPPPPAQSAPPAAANDVPAQATEAPPAQGGVAEPTFAAQDDYVYYPSYNVYYSSHLHKYASLEGNAWVSRPAPRGVTVNVLQASPSVKMDFHDSPANHHEEVVKKYPKNWTQERK